MDVELSWIEHMERFVRVFVCFTGVERVVVGVEGVLTFQPSPQTRNIPGK